MPNMSAGFGFWLLGMSLGASALGGMLGMAGGIFIVLARQLLPRRCSMQ